MPSIIKKNMYSTIRNWKLHTVKDNIACSYEKSQKTLSLLKTKGFADGFLTLNSNLD